jgi:hypothetical protein
MIRKLLSKIKSLVKKYWWIAAIWYTIKIVTYITIILWLTSCENTYKPNKNYRYTFSGMSHKDNIGRKIYGSHHFILDEKIKDMESFKECYVNYLQWSGLDKDGNYKKNFYDDRKNVYFTLEDEVWGRVTVSDADLCN